MPAQAAVGRSVTTVAGLMEDNKPNRLQQAFIDEQAAQCGYCISGIIMVARALLDRNPEASESEIRSALNGNLCRCGTHNRIVRAVLRAAGNNDIELYWDRPETEWPRSPEGHLAMYTRALDLRALLRAAD
jgi:aerobic-type carbon monoxide dehydrogenase small subunit (CoxS/CutS family)